MPDERTGSTRHPRGRGRRLEVDHVTVVDRKPMRTAIAGAVVGNGMEWYDFGIYGYLTATMTTVFVPDVPQQWQLLVVLAGFAVSFLVRPIGGLVLGPLGDRIGRQKTLALTMIMMSLATGAIGLLPTSAQVGNWALVGLILCRVVQGFSTGGEYAGATTFVSEYAPDNRRGFLASILDTGSYLGFAVGAATVAVCQVTLGQETMLAWGWRVPFLLALPLGAIAMFFRLRIEESPAFEKTKALSDATAAASSDAPTGTSTTADAAQPLGLGGLLRHHWRPILIAVALVGATNTAGYSLTSYMPSYLEANHGYTGLQASLATIPALVALSIAVPFVGKLSDRIGRKPVYAVAIVSTIVLTVPAYLMMANPSLVWVSMLMLAFSVTFYVAISASALPALFPTASRYGAMAIAYNISVSLFGGTAPMIGELLVKVTGITIAPAFYTIAFAVFGGIALLTMKESAGRPLPGSMPTVGSSEEAQDLVDTQEANPRLDVADLPFEEHDAATAALADANGDSRTDA
ncbi:MFS transporter [Mobilicoccus pelagius]|uniref:Putative proline/betaine transporter n=1 Tax=Mobilicoccus pelagius NBRC 104925 TaxID=1089455 RepID=H5UVM9_9MICO|nr:MFS transporter [Mobilicoccus pelagius]GAB49787.1 proline/betaine transporter [Mobilicoccus pelagius NBRC 104925]